MKPLAAIVALLAGHADVAGLVADRVTTRPDEEVALPAVWVEPLPGVPAQVFQQRDPFRVARFRVHGIAGRTAEGLPDEDTAADLYDALEDALLGARHTDVAGVHFQTVTIEGDALGEDEETHNARVAFRVACLVRPA